MTCYGSLFNSTHIVSSAIILSWNQPKRYFKHFKNRNKMAKQISVPVTIFRGNSIKCCDLYVILDERFYFRVCLKWEHELHLFQLDAEADWKLKVKVIFFLKSEPTKYIYIQLLLWQTINCGHIVFSINLIRTWLVSVERYSLYNEVKQERTENPHNYSLSNL